ncbi:hypothetical protein LPJ64_004807, partial [Coemansia asiatica]
NSQSQQLIVAQWIGCCEHVLAIMSTPASSSSSDSSSRPAFVRIEDIEIEDPMAKLEHAAAQTDKKAAHAGSGRTGSPAPSETANQPLSANGPPVPPGAPRPPVPPLSHLHQIHQQQPQQYNQQPPGQQKRPYGAMISSERASIRTTPSQREPGTTQLAEFGRSRSQAANGTGTAHYGLHMAPEMMPHGNGSMMVPISHMPGSHSGGPGVPPSGSSGVQSGFRKRGGRHRSRGPQAKEGGSGASIGAGSGGHGKRGKNPGSERPRIKDH